MANIKIDVVHAKQTERKICSLDEVSPTSSVLSVKKAIARQRSKYQDVNRQELRAEPRGKALRDEQTLDAIGVGDHGMLYFKDRGLQIGWTTVFLAEYAGPLFVYCLIATRPWLIYGETNNKTQAMSLAAKLGLICWASHYIKRLLETMFVHRFSNATMPIMNLFKNCSYYWGFAAYVAYHVNHPLFTAPADLQVLAGLAIFVVAELGNLSIHVALRNLRPAGSKVRKIPFPTGNPLTSLFNYVSCPNYTYETLAWIGFTIMTQCLPAGLFCLAGFYQMSMWALGKHRNYKKEFPDYPRRKAIVPFIL